MHQGGDALGLGWAAWRSRECGEAVERNSNLLIKGHSTTLPHLTLHLRTRLDPCTPATPRLPPIRLQCAEGCSNCQQRGKVCYMCLDGWWLDEEARACNKVSAACPARPTSSSRRRWRRVIRRWRGAALLLPWPV